MIFKLDENGDRAVENNSFVMLEGQEEIEQNLSQKLRFFYAEWFLDKRLGIPYFEQILIKRWDPVVVDAIFKNEILITPGILELLSFLIDFEPSTRIMALSFQSRTKFGILTIKDFILGV